MSDATRIAAVGVRFAAVYTLFQGAIGLMGVAGLARMSGEMGAIGLLAVLLILVLGLVLWFGASSFGAMIARGLD